MKIIYYEEFEKLNLEIKYLAQVKIIIISFSKQSSIRNILQSWINLQITFYLHKNYRNEWNYNIGA